MMKKHKHVMVAVLIIGTALLLDAFNMSAPFKDVAKSAALALSIQVTQIKDTEATAAVEEVLFGSAVGSAISIHEVKCFSSELRENGQYIVLLDSQFKPEGCGMGGGTTNVLLVEGKDAKGLYEITAQKAYDVVPLNWVKRQLRGMKKRANG